MITHVDEPITIGVVFEKGGAIRPAWFKWNNRNFKIKEKTFYWTSKLGQERILHFSVVDQHDALYELRFYTLQNTWKLYQIQDEK